ncbi:MAG: DUF4366 domain-containing protein [Clostridia bacterium]|nr:DUF4366 domain-containing protein [Clostridia bacterium]
MQKRIVKRLVPVFVCALLTTMPAAAQVGKGADMDTEPAIIIPITPTPMPTPIPYEPVIIPERTEQPFTIAGNAEIIDDISDGTKEFYTITTANNNTFFIVVDKDRAQQNVYMLAKVDENDVAEFIENRPEATPSPMPTLMFIQPTPAPTLPVTVVPETQSQPPSNNILLIGALALAAAGAGWYFKVYKPKQEQAAERSEGMEYSGEQHDDQET